MTKILISAMNGIIGYELIKYLKKKYFVIAIDNEENGIAKKIANRFIVSPKGNTKNFIKFIEKISNEVDLMFFYVDEELLNISNNLKNKKVLDKIVISRPDSINKCLNKKKFYDILYKNKVLTPKIKVSAPAFIKPIFGRGSKNCFYTNSNNILKPFVQSNKYITQKFISGKEYTVDCYFNNKFKLVYSLTRERVVKSNISLTNKIQKNKVFSNICSQVSNLFNFKGPINFQFIVEDKSNIPYLLEINPRLSGGVIFSILSGFNPITMAINEAKNDEVLLPKKIKYGKYTRYLTSRMI